MYVGIFMYSCVEIIIWKENKAVDTICIVVRIPKKNIFKIFVHKFPKLRIIFGFKNYILEENKDMFGNGFFPQKTSKQ